MFIPIAIIMAIANQHFSLYLIAQIVCGYVFPGRPVANMVFTVYCYISSSQAVKFSSDLKLGHYMKIPPKLMFMVQMAATLVSSLAQVGVLSWMFANVPSLCTIDAVNGFSCPLARVHFNGSILRGVVGPHRFFGEDALYHNLIWAFPVGVIAPLILWLAWRKTQIKFLRRINLPLLLGSLSWIPPAVCVSSPPTLLICCTSYPSTSSFVPFMHLIPNFTRIDCTQLLRLDTCLLHIQPPHQASRASVVEQVYHDSVSSTRLGSGFRPAGHFLLLCVSWSHSKLLMVGNGGVQAGRFSFH